MFDNIGKNIENSALANYPLTKQAAKGLLYVGQFGYNTFQSLFKVNQATTQNHSSISVNQNQTEQKCTRQSLVSSQNFRDILVIKHCQTGQEVFSSSLPYFQNISSIKFSQSGELLAIGNEKAQYFYILRLHPPTNFLHHQQKRRFQIIYSLFRGYTSSQIHDIVFARDEKWISLISSHGTCHIYRLDSHCSKSEQHILKRNNQQQINGENQITQVVHLSAFGRIKVAREMNNGLHNVASSFLFLMDHKPGPQFSSYLSQQLASKYDVSSHKSSRKKAQIATVCCRNGTIIQHLLYVEKEGQNQFINSKGENKIKSGAFLIDKLNKGLLNREKMPVKSNYFLDKLYIHRLGQCNLAKIQASSAGFNISSLSQNQEAIPNQEDDYDIEENFILQALQEGREQADIYKATQEEECPLEEGLKGFQAIQSSQIIQLNTNPIIAQKNKRKYSILKKKTDHQAAQQDGDFRQYKKNLKTIDLF